MNSLKARRTFAAGLTGGAFILPLAMMAHAVTAPAAAKAAPPDIKLTESMGDGLHGYISMEVTPPPKGFGAGVSFYVGIWPLLAKPLKSFQIGLPGTWILPDNLGYELPLCPHGTLARDQWANRGPSYRDVFQTIEGGGGFWDSTKFPSVTPKYRMNGTPDCYNDEISSPGWSFYGAALPAEKMALVQISNRLLVPPDGLTFKSGTHGELFGSAWMALPLMQSSAAYHRQPTGNQNWTFFVNAENFKGPVAYWISDTWSAIAKGYPPAAGRTLDLRPGLMAGGAMEVNTVPYFSNKDSHGVLYSRIPKLLFPVNDGGITVLMQDVRMYSRETLYDSIQKWDALGAQVTGTFDSRGAMTPSCTNKPLKFDQHTVPLIGFEAFVGTTMVGPKGSCSFGLKWRKPTANFPQYFKQVGNAMVAIPPSRVPAETELRRQTFAVGTAGQPYTSLAGPGTVWSNPGPRSGPFTVVLTDGSQITYYWYRFVDQPALQHLHLNRTEKARLQTLVERIQDNWPINRNYMAPPSSGKLADLDPAIIVTPPPALKIGYVPIIVRQEVEKSK